MKLRLWMIFISIVLILFAVAMFNRSVVSVHLNELSNAVDELNKKQRGFNTMDVLFKYEINRRLYSGLITEAEYDREELKTISEKRISSLKIAGKMFTFTNFTKA